VSISAVLYPRWPPLLKIEISSNGQNCSGVHLGRISEMLDTFLEEDHPRIISAKFGLDWLSSFRGEDFFKISSTLFSNFHNPAEVNST
jgi:hypothetical protein